MDRRYAILVVDDDEYIRELLFDLLSRDYDVHPAQDALEAVDSLSDRMFDLMIMDLGMPVMDGVQLIRKIRSYPNFDTIPILVISAYPELRAQIVPHDVQAVLAKPFSIDALTRLVKDTIGQGRPAPDQTSPLAPS